MTAVVLLSGAFSDAFGQETPIADREEQRRRSRLDTLDRKMQPRRHAPNLMPDIPETILSTSSGEALDLPEEVPCFIVHRIELTVSEQSSKLERAVGAAELPFDPFRFATDYLRRYTGACVGQNGLQHIATRLTDQIVKRGYSTTRISFSEQNISDGRLALTLTPGVIRNIRLTDPTIYGTWRNAFPTGAGRLLRLAELEQGLEHLKRVPGQDVEMTIAPTGERGKSDVLLDVKRRKMWRLTGSFDDSGAKDTGQLQGGVNLAMDNPLGLSDLFNVGLNTDADRKAGLRGTGGYNAYYAVPVGYGYYSLSASHYKYHRQIAGHYQNFVYSGKSSNLELKVNRTFQRSASQKNRWQLKVGKRWSRTYIDDTEIEIQRRNTTFVELGWLHTHYVGNAQLDLMFANRWGSSYLQGMGNAHQRDSDDPAFMYTLQSIDATLVAPFTIAGRPLTYIGSFRAQNTRSALYLSDQFSIGGRYTVRGFDGELTLSAERGFYLRNELELPIAKTGQSIYAGVDIGKVYGPGVRYLPGDKLAGGVIGMRGRYRGLRWETFSGWPLYKPAGFKTATPAVGFSLAYQY